MQFNYTNFRPTYLMIKQHEVTGLKYLCKTIRKNPMAYRGSGLKWLSHIKKYGKEHVRTIWYRLYTDPVELNKTAIALSEMFDVVMSDSWANLIIEDGFGGGGKLGRKCTPQQKENINKPKYGHINVRDSDGNTFRTSVDNPDYVSGKLVPVSKNNKGRSGHKQTESQKLALEKINNRRSSGVFTERELLAKETIANKNKARCTGVHPANTIYYEYMGEVYAGFDNLFKATGISKYRYKKYFLNEIKVINHERISSST